MHRNVVLSPRESSHSSSIDVGFALRGGLVVFFERRDGFEVFGFKYLVTIQASDIVDPVAPRHNLGSTVIAGLHNQIKPILNAPFGLSSPQITQVGRIVWSGSLSARVLSRGATQSCQRHQPLCRALSRAISGRFLPPDPRIYGVQHRDWNLPG